MTQDEIIEMAREVGFDISKPNRIIVRHSNGSWVSIKFELEAFAKLVAAKERETLCQAMENQNTWDLYDPAATAIQVIRAMEQS